MAERITLGYARCSTAEQDVALEAQIFRLKEAGADRVISELISGRNNERPGMLEAMAMVKKGFVKELLVTRVDRLGRDAGYADQLLALCQDSGVIVRALDGGEIETASPQGFLMARMMTSMAEMESKMLSLRIKKSLAVYRAQGRHLKRRMIFGYTKGDDYKLAPHPENWDRALYVIDLLRELGTFTKVSQRLGREDFPWAPASGNLQFWFINPTIRGHIPHLYDRSSGKSWKASWQEIYFDQHPALISERDWRELADRLRRVKNNFEQTGTSPGHALTGVVSCMNCGQNLRRNTSRGTVWWSCRNRNCKKLGRGKESNLIQLAAVESAKSAKRLAQLLAQPQEEDPRLAMKRADLQALQALAARNPSMLPAVEAVKTEIAALQKTDAPELDLEKYEVFTRDPGLFLDQSPAVQRALFLHVLQTIQVGQGGVTACVPRVA
jgi:DNA invertase Pin-like site-specific DNA recombinase